MTGHGTTDILQLFLQRECVSQRFQFVGQITHQDLGQMQMYVNYYDRHVKLPDESPTVGIILCKQNHEALVEITLPEGANVHARQYKLVLPSKADLRRKLLEWTGEAEP